MKAIVTSAPGGWDHTRLEERPDPVPGVDECLVELKAIGINPADYFQIEGNYPGQPPAPFIDGRDGAGVVLEPDQKGRWKKGDKVVVLQTTKQNLAEGTLCERQKFPADALAPVPQGWSFEEAGSCGLVMQTAWRALVVHGQLKKGQAVVVTGASGGVGSAAVLLARALGAQVVALSRSPEKRSRLLEIGAHHAFDPADKELRAKINAATGKKGVELVLENVGGPQLKQSVQLLGVKGKVLVVGLLAGVDGVIPIPSLMFKQCAVEGVVVSAYTPEESRTAWDGIVAAIASIKARPIVDRAFPLANYLDAFDRLKGSPLGKVVLTTGSA